MKDLTPKSSLCMSSWSLEPFLCFFLSIPFYQVLRGRRALLYPNLWKPVPLTTMWTTNGSLGLPSRPPAATRPAHVRGRATSVMLARIPSNEYQIRNDDNVEVEIKFNDFEEYNDKFKIKLIFIITSHISLLLASFVSN